MADTLKRIVGPVALTNAAATQYTVPAATKTTIRQIHVSNNTGATVDFTMSIGADAAGKRFFDHISIPTKGDLDWNGILVMEATEILQAYGSAINLTMTVSAVETT